MRFWPPGVFLKIVDCPDGCINTFSGLRFWPLNPDPEKILIGDIVHALAHQCRFGGHASRVYSVAEHSVHISRLCPPEVALWGLLHDASQAYLVDLPRPLKQLPEFAAYREAERRLQRMIAVRFGLPPEQPASVTEADDAAQFPVRQTPLHKPFHRPIYRFPAGLER